MKLINLNLDRENQSLLSKRRNHHIHNLTPAERHIKSLLDALGERYIAQKGFFTVERFFIVDFYLPKRGKLCLEIDGKYHEDNQVHDKRRDRFLCEWRNGVSQI